MRLLKYRLISFALVCIFCIGAFISPINNEASAKEYNEPSVRIGMYVETSLLDTKQFSSLNKSSTGFELGYSNGDSFESVYKITNNSIILFPSANVRIDGNEAIKDSNGSVGAYSAIMSSHSNASSAFSEAKRIGGFVAFTKGGFEVRKFSATTASMAKSLSGGRTVASPVSGGITAVDASSGKIIFVFEGNKTFALRAANKGTVNIPVMHRSGSVNSYDYRGFFEYKVDSGLLFMVNVIGLEEYTRCVMANEIGTNVSVETRKAFAVLARTVPLGKKHSSRGYDVCCNSACCQVYYGTHRMSEENNKIVDATRGLFCAYEGKPITVLYHNSNGGASCSSVAAWGGNEIPYLTTVFQEEQEGGDKWEKTFTKTEFYEYMSSRKTFSALEDENITVEILAKDPYGSDYITLLAVSDGSGNVITVETSEDVRSACGFTSANFYLEYSAELPVITSNGLETRSISGILTADGYKPIAGFGDVLRTTSGEAFSASRITVKGTGIGHGVGFSATGSEQLASEGYSYKYILSCFFNGTTLETVH